MSLRRARNPIILFDTENSLPMGTWSNAAGPPLTLETFERINEILARPISSFTPDNVTEELLSLAKQNNKVNFIELAKCTMPKDEVDECWIGARMRLGLPA